VLEELVKVHL